MYNSYSIKFSAGYELHHTLNRVYRHRCYKNKYKSDAPEMRPFYFSHCLTVFASSYHTKQHSGVRM